MSGSTTGESIPIRSRGDRPARAFAWSVWLAMLLACLVCFDRYARNIPQTEGWVLVPALTGNEPNLLGSLWAQNNEHRVPFPKLVLLALLKATGGDFRAGMILNIGMLAASAAALLLLARRVRGGVTRYADAIFPIGLLHLGNWENLFWGWQAVQVIPTVLILAELYLLIRSPGFRSMASAAAGAVIVLLLPLSSANGLLFAPFFAGWLGYRGVRQWRGESEVATRRAIPLVLIGSAAGSILLCGLYFVGYVRPSWVPSNPGPVPSILAAAQFVALGFGPVARSSWPLSIAAALLFLLPSAGLAVRSARKHGGGADVRSSALLVFVSSIVVFVLAIGWGRAGVIDVYRSWPIRYSHFAVLALFAAYFLWELHGSSRWRRIVQNALLSLMVFLIPLNSRHGMWWRDWYVAGADAVIDDLRNRPTASEVAYEHVGYLYHSMKPAALAELMRMLKREGMDPWVQLRDHAGTTGASADTMPAYELVAQELDYRDAGATGVTLIWGLDGWQALSGELLPSETEIEGGLMRTPMARTGDGGFRTRIRAPAGSAVDYRFSVVRDVNGTEDSILDGDYSAIAGASAVLAHEGRSGSVASAGPMVEAGRLVERDFRYRLDGAGEIILVWGVDGWRVVPQAAEPGKTIVEDDLMQTRMSRERGVFTATVRVPEGAVMNYGFLVTDKPGFLDLVSPLWDERSDSTRAAAGLPTVDIRSSLTLPDEWAEVREEWRVWLRGLAFVAGLWVLLYLGLGVIDRRRDFRFG
jgi:hypothetical protein